MAMARSNPPPPTPQKRIKSVDVRVTVDELARLERRAQERGISVAALLRMQALADAP